MRSYVVNMIENQKTYHVTVLNEISMIDKDPYLEGERKCMKRLKKGCSEQCAEGLMLGDTQSLTMHEENAKYLITVNYNLIAN